MPVPTALDSDSETISLAQILNQISGELEHAARSCHTIQWSISSLLDKVDHPDLAAEIHMLQDVDRLYQTLTDLAAILAASGGGTSGAWLSRDAIGGAIRMESLRQRLGLGGRQGATPADTDEDYITWF